MYHANNNHKEVVTVSILGKVDFRTRNITREKDNYFIVIKGLIHQEDIQSYMCMHPVPELQNT